MAAVRVRPAQARDHEDVRAMCADTWSEHGGDYLPRVYPDWFEGPDRHTLVATVDGTVVGIAQAVLLTDTEAWCQGLRVHPAHRGNGIAEQVMTALFEWAESSGATMARSMVYSWNVAGLGVARAVGFDPVTSFRFARPEPEAVDHGSSQSSSHSAWDTWTASEAHSWLGGLCLDREESWAMRRCRRDDLATQGISTASGAVALRGRTYEPQEPAEAVGQEYALAAWPDAGAATDLFRAIAADAGTIGATTCRVVVPETPAHVSDVAMTRTSVDAEPHFVLATTLPATSHH